MESGKSRTTGFLSDRQRQKKDINQFLAKLQIQRPDDATLATREKAHEIYDETGRYMLLPAQQRCPLVLYKDQRQDSYLINIMTGEIEFSGDLLQHRQSFLRRLMIFWGCYPEKLRTVRHNRVDLPSLPSVGEKYGRTATIEQLAQRLEIGVSDQMQRYFQVCKAIYEEFGYERCIVELAAENAFQIRKQLYSVKFGPDCFAEW